MYFSKVSGEQSVDTGYKTEPGDKGSGGKVIRGNGSYQSRESETCYQVDFPLDVRI